MNTQKIIQVAGIRNSTEAQLLLKAGVDWLGFPFCLEYHQEDLTKDLAREIIQTLPPPHVAVLITYLTKAQDLLSLMDQLSVSAVQLHGSIDCSTLQQLRETRSNLFVLKSLIVRQHNQKQLEQEVLQFSPFVDAFITDTFDPETGASGATGKTHNWYVSHTLVQMSPRPLILAGGLTPENVADAILQVKPAGVDVHTGVEDRLGRKDPQKVQAFVQNARNAFQKIKTSP